MGGQQDAGMSKALYIRLCQELGTPTQMKIRKEVMKVRRELYRYEGIITAGSYNEGFRFPDSDMDNMVSISDARVISDLSQKQIYDKKNIHLLLLNCDGLKPGSAKLQYVCGPDDKYPSRCLPCDDVLCLPSKKFRQVNSELEDTYEHGPCISHDGREHGTGETDVARCLKSDTWPPQASEWLTRCNFKGWPPHHMVIEIMDGGCHLAPVGVKFSKTEDFEWRISFAVAETTLVHSLNHCQFLTYGLLKMFLKKIINKNDAIAEALCSYHLKTAIFWEVQETHKSPWIPETLLDCFWRCFHRIYTWIQAGNCPNFFIPENNIFKEKVYGPAKVALLKDFKDIKDIGNQFMLKIPELRKVYEVVYAHPQLLVGLSTEEESIRKESDFDETYLEEIVRAFDSLGEPKHFCVKLDVLGILCGAQTDVGTLIPSTAQILLCQCARLNTIVDFQALLDKRQNNVDLYERHDQFKAIEERFERLSKWDLTSGKVWLAIFYYMTGEYERCLRTVETMKKSLEPHIMYPWYVDHDLYTSKVCGRNLSPLEKFQKFVALHVEIPFYFHFPRLRLEQIHAQRRYVPILAIPPLILGEMLNVLCYKSLNDADHCQSSLEDLRGLLQRDDGFHYHDSESTVLLEVLGICEEECGNDEEALQACIQAFKSRPQGFADASLTRILLILYKRKTIAKY